MPRQSAAPPPPRSRPVHESRCSRRMISTRWSAPNLSAPFSASPPNHFQTSDVATLAAYARCVIAEKRAAGELDAAPVIDGKAGREASKAGEDKPEPIVSAFERLAMEAYRDDGRN